VAPITLEEDFDKPHLKDALEEALFHSDRIWSTCLIEIASEEKIIQNYKQIIENKSEKDLIFIRLPHRIKKIQRNLEIRNSAGNELVYVPYKIVNCFLIEICKEYLEKLIKKLKYFEFYENKKISGRDTFINETKGFDFSNVFRYLIERDEKREKDIDNFLKLLENIEDSIPEKLKEYTSKIYYLVGTYKNFYIPIVKLDKKLKSDSCTLISYTIESLNQENMPTFKSQLEGESWCNIPLEVESGIENHLKIKPAYKTSLTNVEIKKVLSNYNKIANKDKDVSPNYIHILEVRLQNMSKYYDSDMLHTMFTPEESTIIWKAMDVYIKKRKEENATKEEEPRIKTKLSIVRTKDNYSSFNSLFAMTMLMYLTLFYPIFTLLKCILKSLQENIPISEFLDSISTSNLGIAISVTYAITIAIWYHSFDRKFLDRYTVIHITIITILWGIISLPFLFGT